MVHTNSVLVAIDPRRPNPTVFQKTISVNDFYHAGVDPGLFPMGNLQPVGKLQGVMMRGAAHTPDWSLRAAAQRSVDWWVMSEDLPTPRTGPHSTPAGHRDPLASQQPGGS